MNKEEVVKVDREKTVKTSFLVKEIEMEEFKRISVVENRTVSSYIRWLIQKEIVKKGDASVLPIY